MLLLAVIVGALLACRPRPEPVGDIVFITLDTTRADALGSYGGPEGISPVLDQLASRGARFEWALSHAPTTLSSHASMFTGLDPHQHEIPRNGFPLAGRFDTLAERLRGAGWDTRAAVGASAVEASTGLNQGFEEYDDRFSMQVKRRFEAPADDVVARALALARTADPQRPMFLWVHLYDAHSPYTAPEPFRDRFVPADYSPDYTIDDALDVLAERSRRKGLQPGDKEWLQGRYWGEIAWLDSQVGELLAGVAQRRGAEPGTVVITSDHGEMFFELAVRPIGHGPDIDLAVTHVPLLISGEGIDAVVVDEVARVSDLGSTILSRAGLSTTLGHGRDLLPLLLGQAIPDVPVFMEATRPVITSGPRWNNAVSERGVVSDGHLLTRSELLREEQLYRLDPSQTELRDPHRSDELGALLDAWDAGAPSFRDDTRDEGVLEALRSLGYLE